MEHTQTVTSSATEYGVHVGGTRPPVNERIIIENVGEVDIVNPVITVNGLYDWFSTERMAAEITRGCRTDQEKAFAIWRWVQDKRFQRLPLDRTCLHPVRYFNVYGYGICGHTAAAMKALGRAAGVPSRVHELWGHTVTEYYYAGAWHVLDGNGRVFYPARDNVTAASAEQIGDDPYLSERSILPQFTYAYQSKEDNYIETSYDEELGRDYTMALTLRPGEKLVRHWRPSSGKYAGNLHRADLPTCFANGELIYQPDLHAYDLSRDGAFNLTTRARDGRDPAVHVAKKQDDLFRKPSSWPLVVDSPYAVVGARLDAVFHRDGESARDTCTVAVLPEGPEAQRRQVFAYRRGTGSREVGLFLDPLVSTQTPLGRYGYRVIMEFTADSAARPPVQTGVQHLRLSTDLQVAPHSLPALSLGDNTVRYRDETRGAGRVRITHQWSERTDNTPPEAPPGPEYPADGAAVDSLIPELRWRPARDPDPGDSIHAYHVQISLREDFAWPVAPNLDVSTPSPRPLFRVPESWLNPDTVYYWRVRARDGHGDWGPFSGTWRFRTGMR